ncbi:thiol:disulfide interchange protein [Porphyrobacter algicida]|uniref:Thiol:disulfide interchange protein n=2 Tax=Qipengyuania algicida TaxID=1836209 RepID=A0A845AGY0_9SPHN|nr:thioredoxin family protein [Qipengyuania algicida]MXP28689.1 thiol:disulfide interchange protein [Qipengyuania algicida]
MLLVAGWAGLLHAQSMPEPGDGAGNNIAVQLLADGPPVAGKHWTLALHFTPKSAAWHGYWANPGDAGEPMRLQWALPKGWNAGDPRYPVPQLLDIAGLANYVFEGPYTVLVPIAVPEGADVANAPPISLRLDYLACTDKICVPERAKLTLYPGQAKSDARFDQWRADIAPDLDRKASFAIEGKQLRLAIPLPASADVPSPHVFIENRDLVSYSAPQSFHRKGNFLLADIPLGAGDAPQTVTGILKLSDGQGVRFAADPGVVPSGGTVVGASAAGLPSVWWALVGAFLGGLILNIMPCVFPILSLKALALARAGGEESGARRDALAYTAGVVLACLALGALMLALRAGGEQIGWAFQLQQPAVVVALLVLAVAITANFLGAFEIPGIAISGAAGSGSGSFATGLLAAFVATPCTGPFMAAALGAALLLPWGEALVLFGALGLGLAFPFLLLGFVPPLRRLLPRPGQWMVTFRRILAVPMALTALALAWLCWRLGGVGFALAGLAMAGLIVFGLSLFWNPALKTRRRSAASVAAIAVAVFALAIGMPKLVHPPGAAESDVIAAQPFSQAALAKARASGKPVFVWFTADWCLTCKVNERTSIEREATRVAFDKAGVVPMVGDWTRRDPEITAFLTQHGAAGVPLYLWYPAGGGAPQQLPQVLTPSLLESLAQGTAPGTGGSARPEAG